MSGIDNIEELMTVFRKNEEETFSLFNYIQASLSGVWCPLQPEPWDLLSTLTWS